MLREILNNAFGKKETLSFPDGFLGSPEDAVKIVALQERIDKIFRRSLRIRQVDAGSCNACEWECTALTNPVYDIQRFGIDFVASPRHADILLVTGPVSRQMELALKKTYIAISEPKLVVACGDCSIDGGVYKGSYAVANGVSNILPVNFFIPGCPPSPLQIIEGFLAMMNKLS
jgi:Ni,Fe-hydrogenase III small subunit